MKWALVIVVGVALAGAAGWAGGLLRESPTSTTTVVETVTRATSTEAPPTSAGAPADFSSEEVDTAGLEESVADEAAQWRVVARDRVTVRCQPGGALAEGTSIQCVGTTGAQDFDAAVTIVDNLGRFTVSFRGLPRRFCDPGYQPGHYGGCVPRD